jgi:ketosteroid isomerase-like protein
MAGCATARTSTSGDIQWALDGLIERSRAANAALMRGDIAQYRSRVELTGDFLLFSPFGGAPTHGRDMTEAAWERMGRFFRNGTFEQEVVAAYGAEDMVVLAIIERSNVEVGDATAQNWALRVTLVYRRDGSEWRLAHRHADPLVAGVSHSTAAALARGDLR